MVADTNESLHHKIDQTFTIFLVHTENVGSLGIKLHIQYNSSGRSREFLCLCCERYYVSKFDKSSNLEQKIILVVHSTKLTLQNRHWSSRSR